MTKKKLSGQGRRDTQLDSAAQPKRGDQEVCETQSSVVAPPHKRRQQNIVTHIASAAQPVPGGHMECVAQNVDAAGEQAIDKLIPADGLPALLAELRETYRQRTDLHMAEKKLTLQIKAIARRMKTSGQHGRDAQTESAAELEQDGDHPFDDTQVNFVAEGEDGDGHRTNDNHLASAAPTFAAMILMEAQEPIKRKRKELEKRLVAIAKQLPVYPMVEAIHGMGALGLAIIIGEAGDLSKYANPGKLWKRMGLAVFNGKSQRRVAGAGAIEQGYNPRRRSAMWTVGDSLLKKKNEYKTLYDTRKAYEKEKAPDLTPMHHHRRAARYVEKRLLLNLWKEWRRANKSLETKTLVPVSIPQAAD